MATLATLASLEGLTMADKLRYRLTFRPAPHGDGPPIARLRRLLKAAVRAYGLICVQAEELPATGPAADLASEAAIADNGEGN